MMRARFAEWVTGEAIVVTLSRQFGIVAEVVT